MLYYLASTVEKDSLKTAALEFSIVLKVGWVDYVEMQFHCESSLESQNLICSDSVPGTGVRRDVRRAELAAELE